MRVSRADVLAYRVAAQQLHRDSGAAPVELAVLDIGLQDSTQVPVELSFTARVRDPVDVAELAGPGKPLALVWSLRGAPHLHRRAELDTLAAALYPLSEADATARLNETGPSVQRAGIGALEQYTTAVRELRASVTTPMAKGAASTEVSRRLPPVMLRDCRTCRARHISDSAMRVALLAAGLELQPDTSPPVLQRRTGAKLPKRPDLAALSTLLRAYLRLLGPATVSEAAGYFEVRRADAEQAWPGDLVEVSVDGRTAWIPAENADDLVSPRPPAATRLLGGFDPFLQARDRELLIPDKAAQKALWPVLGRPGAVLADGEIVGAWRPKTSGRSLTIMVSEFGTIPKPVRGELAAEAERVAASRGMTRVQVAYA